MGQDTIVVHSYEDDVRDLVRTWQQRLGLGHWTITVVVGDLDHDDAILEIDRHENADRAVLHIAPWYVEGKWDATKTSEVIDRAYIEQAVVHELVHLYFRDVTFVIRDDLAELLGQVTHELVMRNLSRHEERAVDGLAKALAQNWGET